MVYSFPMGLADFFGGLPIAYGVPDLGEAMEYNQDGSGAIITADMGPRLWRNDINIRIGNYAEIEQIMAKLQVLRQAGRSLLVHSYPLIAPQADPKGAILGASVVTLTAVAPNNREIELSGLPLDYKLQPGDFLSFQYGSNPVRYAMHQVVNTRQANSLTKITGLEVVPFIRPGYTLPATVTLIKPIYKAVVIPGTTERGKIGSQVADGIKFSVIQTLR